MVTAQPATGMQVPLPSRFRRFLPSLAWVGAAVAAAWVLNIIWWGLLSPEARDDGQSRTVTIPAGTAAAIARGADTSNLVSQLSVPDGGSLFIKNLDSVEHTVSVYKIPPGETVEIKTLLLTFVTPQGSKDEPVLNCSFHPSGYIGFTLTHRPPFYSTLILGLLLGAPLGGLIAIAAFIVSKLDSGESGDTGSLPA